MNCIGHTVDVGITAVSVGVEVGGSVVGVDVAVLVAVLVGISGVSVGVLVFVAIGVGVAPQPEKLPMLAWCPPEPAVHEAIISSAVQVVRLPTCAA